MKAVLKYGAAETMPRAPKGERRPADEIGNAVHVMRVLTGETVMDWSEVIALMDAEAGSLAVSEGS